MATRPTLRNNTLLALAAVVVVTVATVDATDATVALSRPFVDALEQAANVTREGTPIVAGIIDTSVTVADTTDATVAGVVDNLSRPFADALERASLSWTSLEAAEASEVDDEMEFWTRRRELYARLLTEELDHWATRIKQVEHDGSLPSGHPLVELDIQVSARFPFFCVFFFVATDPLSVCLSVSPNSPPIPGSCLAFASSSGGPASNAPWKDSGRRKTRRKRRPEWRRFSTEWRRHRRWRTWTRSLPPFMQRWPPPSLKRPRPCR